MELIDRGAVRRQLGTPDHILEQTRTTMGLEILDHSGKRVVHGRKTVNNNSVRLHYYTAGSGPVVLLLHGVPKTSYVPEIPSGILSNADELQILLAQSPPPSVAKIHSRVS